MDVPKSSPSVEGTHDYDVFLSFRGSETRRFADLLYHSLADAGLRVFRDEEETPVGECVGPFLLQAIKRSRISIPIFSKDYASSKHCLSKVVQMSECRQSQGQMIFPIFCGVDSSDLRNQTGAFKEAFVKDERDGIDPDTAKIWKRALRDIGSLKGWELPDDRIGAKQIKQIVSYVLQRLEEDMTSDISRSSSSVGGTYDYDVYLSFSSDTRRGFANLLYHSLTAAGIHVFRDEEELLVGEYVSPFLLQVIEHSRISIPIFSKNYASSIFTLEEVVRMVECTQSSQVHMIMPIYYGLDPKDITYQDGAFRKSFTVHESNGIDPDRIETWRWALREVANIIGWALDDQSSDAHIKSIISAVCRYLNSEKQLLPKNLVGLDDHVEEMIKMLDANANDVRTVGICGMGGVGKTTLAKSVYNRLFYSFERCAFLPDVRERSKRDGLPRLQNDLVSQILMQPQIEIVDCDEGIHLIRALCRNKRVLVVLDDINSREQLDALAGAPHWFGPGSRVIITTRRLDIFNTLTVFGIYKLKPMGAREALELFCIHAFGKGFPPEGYYDLSVDFTSAAGGVPLALEVMGSMLSHKSKAVWNGASQKSKLLSFPAIEEKLFSLYPAIGHLVDRSLVKIGIDHDLQMHDQLRALGQDIVGTESSQEPGERSRLGDADDAVAVLKEREGTKHVEALCLKGSDDSRNQFTHLQFHHLSKLPAWECSKGLNSFSKHLKNPFILDLSNNRDTGDPNDLLNLHLENLVTLDLSNSRVTGDPNTWMEVLKMATRLKVLRLNHCSMLRVSPRFPAQMGLKILSLEGCSRLMKIDPTIGNLKELECLNLNFCSGIDHLPDELALMENLKKLLIDGTSIRDLYFAEGSMQQLEVLSARSCTSLARIPDSIGSLKSLRVLVLDNTIIEELPSSILQLPDLQDLSLRNCPKLRPPKSFESLKVDLSNSKTGELPSISKLENLNVLKGEVEFCKSLDDTEDPWDITKETSAAHYEVVLSFSTHKEIVSLLCEDIKNSGICVFGVNWELCDDSEENDKKFLWAIQKSDICIPIFTKDYASNARCLRELAHLVECQRNSCRQQVVPIFCDVEPSDVKLETDLYFNALLKHKDNFPLVTVRMWEEALREAAKLKGWIFKAKSLKEDSKFTVSAILNKLKVKRGNSLVGVLDQAEKLKKVLDIESQGVLIVGIHGIGGVGKTTLAKAVFDQISTHFEGCSFLNDIRETSKRWGLMYLHAQLLREITGADTADTDHETKTIRHRFLEKKVLIVLDDIDDRGQIKKLVGMSNQFVSGSRIIITTRDINVLAAEHETMDGRVLEWPAEIRLFKMEEMKFAEAHELFCSHAFGKVDPPENYRSRCGQVVSALGGLPLALEILGSFLNHKPADIWKMALEKLEKSRDQGLHTKLMISYEALEPGTKEIFLDIACLFSGREKTTPICMWDACELFPEQGIEVLIYMSFVKISCENRLWMHDVVREFGREIVSGRITMDCATGSRLWVNQEVLDILRSAEVNEKVQGLRLSFDEFLGDCTVPDEELGSLPNLRFLELSGFPFALKRDLPKLRWLSWHFCPNAVRTADLYLDNLVILDLSHSSITDHQLGKSGQLGRATNLKVLNLTSCKGITKTPIFFTCMILERLILEDCENLVEIHRSIGNLKKLMYLNLKGCNSLKGLPNKLSSAKALTEIVMKGNGQSFYLQKAFLGLTSLSVLEIDKVEIVRPFRVGKAKRLERLSLSECSRLEKLPKSCQFFTSMVELDLAGAKISKLPNTIGDMKKLKVINMESSSISELPRSIEKLENLEELLAKNCELLHGEIPSEIGSLSSLRILNLSFTSISSLPSTLCQLSNLQILNLEFCHELIELPELPKSLVRLHVVSKKLQNLPDLSGMCCLTDLQLFCAADKFQADWVWKLSRLEKLELGIPRITTLDFGVSSQLRSLSLSCLAMKTLPQLPSTLFRLCLAHLKEDAKFPSLRNLKSLTFIEFYNCSMGDDAFRSLGVGDLKSLEHLSAIKCDFPGVNETHLPERLRVLRINKCQLDEGILDLSRLKNLMHLELMHCQTLTVILGLEKLEFLAEMTIRDCNSLEILRDISNLRKLEALQIDSCKKLKEVNGLGIIKSLKHLEIRGCKSLQSRPRPSASKTKLYSKYFSGTMLFQLFTCSRQFIICFFAIYCLLFLLVYFGNKL